MPDRGCYGAAMDGDALTTNGAKQLRLPLERHGPGEPFVISDCNAVAVDRLARWPDGDMAVLALVGPPGCGKSRLAVDWAERVGAVVLRGEEASLLDPVEAEGRPVLLDDAQDADDEALFHLINLAQSGGGALLLVSRTAPRAWDCALPDLRSRLDAIVAVALESPDDPVLAAILRTRFAARSITPAEDVIAYLTARIGRSAAAAEAVVDRLDAAHRPVTKVLARQLLDTEEATADLFV